MIPPPPDLTTHTLFLPTTTAFALKYGENFLPNQEILFKKKKGSDVWSGHLTRF